MKRILLIFLLVSISALTEAQLWLGGEVHINTDKITVSNHMTESHQFFGISPEIGYHLNSHWAIAMRLGYAYLSNYEFKLFRQTIPGSGNEIHVEPFIRYTFYQIKRVSFFTDMGASYSYLQRYTGPSQHGVSISGNVGIQFDLNSRVGFTGRFGAIGYNYSWMHMNGYLLKEHNFVCDIVGCASLGVYININQKKHDTD